MIELFIYLCPAACGSGVDLFFISGQGVLTFTPAHFNIFKKIETIFPKSQAISR